MTHRHHHQHDLIHIRIQISVTALSGLRMWKNCAANQFALNYNVVFCGTSQSAIEMFFVNPRDLFSGSVSSAVPVPMCFLFIKGRMVRDRANAEPRK